MILASKTHLPFPTTRLLRTATTMLRKEQKRNATLTMDTLNPLVKEVEYAVRGPVVIRASELENQLKLFPSPIK